MRRTGRASPTTKHSPRPLRTCMRSLRLRRTLNNSRQDPQRCRQSGGSGSSTSRISLWLTCTQRRRRRQLCNSPREGRSRRKRKPRLPLPRDHASHRLLRPRLRRGASHPSLLPRASLPRASPPRASLPRVWPSSRLLCRPRLGQTRWRMLRCPLPPFERSICAAPRRNASTSGPRGLNASRRHQARGDPLQGE